MIREFRLLLFFLLGVVLSANAVLAFAGEKCFPNWVEVFNGQDYTDGNAWCGAINAAYPQYGGKLTLGGDGWCGPVAHFNRSTSRCSGGSSATWDGVDWVCPCPDPNPCASKLGMYYNNGQFSPSNLAGGDGAFSGPTSNSRMPSTFCQDGCQMDSINLEGGAAGNMWYGRGNPQFTGQQCLPGDGPGTNKAPPSPEYDCVKAGKGFGYFNGAVICTDINNSKAKDTKTKTTTNPDGTKTEVKTDTKIECDGVNCVTTTTTTTTTFDANGNQTSTSSKTDSTSKPDPGNGNGPKADSGFCAENPTSPMCKQGSFGASCTSEPSCDGDPVQCATAKATWQSNCKAMKAGDPPATTDPVGERKIPMTFNSESLGTGGSCPADKTAVINGVTIRLPFSALCELAAGIRPVVIALGWLVAGFIVFGYGKKQGG